MAAVNLQMDERKKQLRKQIAANRSALPVTMHKEKSAVICQRALEQIQFLRAQFYEKDFTLFTYMPFRSEVNLLPIAVWCWEQGIRVAAPRVVLPERMLAFHYIASYEDLYPQPPWGIQEPSADAPKVESALHQGCMLVPGLAFDIHRGRLGYGGGFYDKYINQLQVQQVSMPYKLALAYDLQIVDEVPCEAHDFRVDMIITETRKL
jgi:5-formyltetrahydrofolate cyclo-ligase